MLDALAGQFLTPRALRQRGFFNPAEIEAPQRRAPCKPYGLNRVMRLWRLSARNYGRFYF
jgi:hypothetical protein